MDDFKDMILQKVSRSKKSICGKCSHRLVCRALDNQPCFECNQFAEEVVRCKDCKHYVNYGRVCDCQKYEGMNLPNEDDFCSYGEKAERKCKSETKCADFEIIGDDND